MGSQLIDARVAVVSGGARGIGAAIARRLAEDGHHIALVDLDAAACEDTLNEIVDAGGKAVAVAADVSDESDVSAAFDEIENRLGAPALLVNNAGIIRDNLLFKMTANDWDAIMDVHLRGAFLMSRAAQRHMVAAGFGRIVNLSSTSALGNRGQANYAAAKAGLQGFTKTLAKELGPYGVTVNAVAPGFIQTAMTAATAKRLGLTFEEFLDSVAKTVPIGRAGYPEDIAHAVSFFFSEGAGYVSGQVLYVAGGPVD